MKNLIILIVFITVLIIASSIFETINDIPFGLYKTFRFIKERVRGCTILTILSSIIGYLLNSVYSSVLTKLSLYLFIQIIEFLSYIYDYFKEKKTKDL